MIEILWFLGGFIAGMFFTMLCCFFNYFSDDDDEDMPIAHAREASIGSDDTIYDLTNTL